VINHGIFYQLGTEEYCFIENRVLSGSGSDILVEGPAQYPSWTDLFLSPVGLAVAAGNLPLAVPQRRGVLPQFVRMRPSLLREHVNEISKRETPDRHERLNYSARRVDAFAP
jgi:hypothetical protein